MEHRDWTLILEQARPGARWSLSGDSLDGLTWMEDDAPPTEDELRPFIEARQVEALWEPIRDVRSALLAACDWTQVADAPVDAAAWAVYRQALRDVPQDFASPDAVVWPTPPAG